MHNSCALRDWTLLPPLDELTNLLSGADLRTSSVILNADMLIDYLAEVRAAAEAGHARTKVLTIELVEIDDFENLAMI